MTQATLYLSTIEGQKHTILCLTVRDPDDMGGEELDDEGIMIERYNGMKISHDPVQIQAAMNYHRNILTSAGIVVIMKS